MQNVDNSEITVESAKLADQQGEHWKKVHADELAKLAVGTTVIIDVATGEYVTAASWFEALDKFEQRFGKGQNIGWSFEVGRPLFVGGGLWRS